VSRELYFFLWKRKGKSITDRIFVNHRTVPAVKRVEVFSDRMSYTVLRGRWCDIIVLNERASTEDKSNDSKDSFCEELEQALEHFPKYHIEILLRDFNPKLGGERIFSNLQLDGSLREGSNDNGTRVVKFPHQKV
jgi:glycerophosphoryl diester phosphodiesterase